MAIRTQKNQEAIKYKRVTQKGAVSLRIQQNQGKKQRKNSENYYLGEFLVRTEPWGRTDLEQKLSADEREAYIHTLSEETNNRIKNFNLF